MKRSASISAVLAALVVGIVLLALQLTSGSDPAGAQPEGGSPAESSQSQTHGRLVRADSHRLQTASDSKVTLVEFLDFECEACRAAYPFVEQLRNDYAGKVTFVLRYFPIASHKNAMNAALAVEAAAQQGKLEPMYQRMYASQAEWGEQQSSQAARFRTDAIVLGLDMAAYDKVGSRPGHAGPRREGPPGRPGPRGAGHPDVLPQRQAGHRADGAAVPRRDRRRARRPLTP